MVGREGVVGIPIYMGCDTPPAWRWRKARVRVNACAPKTDGSVCPVALFMHLMLLYTQALITQTAETAVCNHRHHSLDQQLCRRLLLSLDRLEACTW